MKLNHEYLKGLLEAFELADGPFTNIEELKNRGFSYETDEFVFHGEILLDKGLIESKSTKIGLGYSRLGSGNLAWSSVPLRLTANGHEFISALRQPDIWGKIQDNFKESSLETIKSVALDLAKEVVKNKLNKILGK